MGQGEADREGLEIKYGMAPGSLVYVGDERSHPVEISVLSYNAEGFEERTVPWKTFSRSMLNGDRLHWIRVNGVHSSAAIRHVGVEMDFHNLALEDVMNTQKRPSIERHGGRVFAMVKMPYFGEDDLEMRLGHVGLALGPDHVFTFYEEDGSPFDPVAERIKHTRWRERGLGPDYLFYALLDCVADRYSIVGESVMDAIEELEGRVVDDPDPDTLQRVYALKRGIIHIRRPLAPLRDILRNLLQSGPGPFREETKPYIADAHDHAIAALENFDAMRDMLTNLVDIHLSTVSNRMNEAMKFLAAVSTLFLPMTFVAGLYGMNFHYMPELDWRWGYPAALGGMVFTAGGLLWYFKSKKWI